MKLFLRILTALLITSLPAHFVNAQTPSNGSEISIPSFEQLVDSALVHNGLVRYRNLEIEAKASNLKSKRNYWTRNFGIQADTRYGTFDNFSSNIDGPITNTLSTTSKQFNYGVGLYLKIPIFDVINRRPQIKQATAELAQAKGLAQAQQDELRETVIKQYQDLLLKQKLLMIRSENLGNAQVNMEMVDKEFRNGLIPIMEYVRISDMTSRIQSEYEKAKSAFQISKKLLENTIGHTFGKPQLK